MSHRILTLVLVASSFLAWSPSVFADNIAIDFNTVGGSSANPTNGTYGYVFTLSQPYQLTALGIMDYVKENGLSSSHEVGLWQLGGSLVSSVTVPSGTGATLIDSADGFNGWRVVSVAPVFLNAGTYVIGAHYASNNTDLMRFGYALNELNILPGITLGNAVTQSGGSLAFPSNENTAFNFGSFGPNMVLNAVPEPASWVLMGMGAVLVSGSNWYFRRRRAKLLDQNAEPAVTA